MNTNYTRTTVPVGQMDPSKCNFIYGPNGFDNAYICDEAKDHDARHHDSRYGFSWGNTFAFNPTSASTAMGG